MSNNNRRVSKVGNRYVVKENGKVRIVTKKKDINNFNNSPQRKVKDVGIDSTDSGVVKLKEIEKNIDVKSESATLAVVDSENNQRYKLSKRNLLIIIFSALILLIVSITIVLTQINWNKFKTEIPSEIKFDGTTISWSEIDEASYYLLNIDGKEYTVTNTSYDLSSFLPKSYEVKVCAVKDDKHKSDYSEIYVFEIAKKEISITAVNDIIITKIYDGNAGYSGEIKLNEHYVINENELKYGQDVDITITEIKFNSINVIDANIVTVEYSTQLRGENAPNYTVAQGAFNLRAKILPKQIKTSPLTYVKQFADEDDLTTQIYDEELNQRINVTFIRRAGEDLGFYDIIEANSDNYNYTIALNENSGVNKFEIVPRLIDINCVEDAFISKVYDGSDEISVDYLNSGLYFFDNTVIGYDVDINITKAVFNSKDTNANKLTIYFSETLIDSKGVYQINKSSIEIDGYILPKTINIIPNRYVKEFGNYIDLVDEYHDTELNQTIAFSYVRQNGENVGLYDILTAQSTSSNYEFIVANDSGKNKFEITKRTLYIKPTDVEVLKIYDNTKIFNGEIKKDINYILVGELEGYDVDVNILSALYDYSTTLEATQVFVEISDILQDNSDVYTIAELAFQIPAKINKKGITIEPKSFQKQYGDSDDLTDTYFDDATDTLISLIYERTAGESVGYYDLIEVKCNNTNFDFKIINSENKFNITKRNISVVSTNEVVTKVFDNTATCNIKIEKHVNYIFENTIEGEEPEIEFSKIFKGSDVTTDFVLLDSLNLIEYTDRYQLSVDSVLLPAKIAPKQVDIEPQYYSVQYGDTEYLRQKYTDTLLGLSFSITFVREEGNEVGNYDIISAISDNVNYQFNILNGAEKYQISPRVLGIEKVGNPTFNKIYDGTTDCILPITQGVHYNLTNLNGGSNVTLNIISQEYDSKNVTEATKVIVRYTAILDGADGDQFITAGGTMEFNAVISPREITVVPEIFNKDYLTEFNLTQNVLDPVSGDIIPVTFSSTAGENHRFTECGTYDITAINWTDTNHTFTIVEGSGVGKFNINRINLTINASNRNTVYNAQGQAIAEPDSIPLRPLSVVYKLTSLDSDFEADLPVNAGTYTARIVFDGDRNYLPQYVERTLFIERAVSIITNTTPTDYVYDGTIKPLTATLNHSEAALVFSRNNYIKAGTYNYIMISVPQTQNYKAASIIVTLTIAKCVIHNNEIDYPNAGIITYGQYLYSSVLSGGSDMGSFNWTEPNTLPVVADKQFLVEFTPYDVENYDWSNVDMQRYVNITVNKFVVTQITFPTASGVIYTYSLATSDLIGSSVYGVFAWQDESIVPVGSGYYNVVFTPYDEANYDFSSIAKISRVYVEVSYRTFFQTNGGSEISPMIVKQIASAPFTYREGYAFDGWFLDETLTQKAEFPLQITKDTVLYAGWYSEGLIFLLRAGYYSVKLDATTVESNIFIPSVYKDLPVRSIENEGFKNCTALEVIVIPESVVSIGHYAFVGCVNLAFVQIINSIEDIDFGKDWIESGYEYGTDVYFNAEPCPDCDGTKDFHQSTCDFNSDNQ